MRRIIEVERDRNQWTEVMLNRLCASGQLAARPMSIEKNRWYEIDNFEDLGEAEVLFNEYLPSLKRRSAYFLDRDGTLTIEGKSLPGARSFVEALAGKLDACFYVLTNNSSKTPSEHLVALNKCGFDFDLRHILLSTDVAARFLKENGLTKVFWSLHPKRLPNIWKHLIIWNMNPKTPQPSFLPMMIPSITISYSRTRNISETGRHTYPRILIWSVKPMTVQFQILVLSSKFCAWPLEKLQN